MKEADLTIPSKCLIIIGMHRSGTSFTASVLQKAGLSIGDKLVAASVGNELGHFENEDFYDFHKKVLSNHSFHNDGWTKQSLQDLYPEEEAQARSIVSQNQTEQWGWKDPRTTLFLNFWKKIIPDANFLFIYRKPWEVADSLFRRNNDKEFALDPSSAIDVWNYYNHEILSFYEKHKERSVLLDIENIIYETRSVIDLLNERFNFSLKTDFQNTFNSGKFVNDQNPIGKVFTETAFPKSITLYQQLQKQSTIAPFKAYEHSNLALDIVANWWYDSTQIQKILNKNQELVNSLNAHITGLNHQLNDSVYELNWIKNSKWWKLRNWLKNLI